MREKRLMSAEEYKEEKIDIGDFITIFMKLNRAEKVKFYYLLKGISFFLEEF